MSAGRTPWVKVCGVTSVDDARWITALGVEAIGLNFVSESPRRISEDLGREIAAALPEGVLAVGVFRDAPADLVDGIAASVGLHRLQLHGNEDAAYCRARAVPVIKAIRPGPGWNPALAAPYRLFPVLVDGYHPTLAGGTGRTADWTAARELVDAGYDVILAGGLHAGNLAEAVRTVKPVAVDLNSGVETAPGKKDKARLIAALEALGRKPGA